MKLHCILFAALALMAGGESKATPMLSPYAIKSSVAYEGGYQLDLQVCESVLCGLEVKARDLRVHVPKEKLAEILDPDIRAATLFVDMTAEKSGEISIEIPYSDFDRKVFPKKKVYVVEIRNGTFHRVSVVERGTGD
jgi:hypothetical protein